MLIKSIVFARQIDPFYLRLLSKNGINAVCVDFLSIKLESQEVLTEKLIPFINIPFVFTSANAVKAVHKIEIMPAKQAFVLTGNTKKLADLAGFEIVGEAENSLALAHVVLSKKVKKIVHLTTKDRIQEFEKVLNQNHIEYSFLEVYSKTKNPQIVSGFDAIVFFSPSQVEAFLTYNVLNPNMVAFCIGHTTGNYLKDKTFIRVVVSEKPTIEHIINSILAFNNKKYE